MSGTDEIEVVGDDLHLNVSEPGEYIIPGAAAAAGLSESKAGVPVAKYKAVLAQAAQLQKENNEFRDVLKRFRDQLLESAVHNSNLTYIVKLFSEHATKPEEKLTIIERFDNEVSSLTESKKLYRTISKELKAKPITEGITSSQALTSGASGLLKEATVYEDETMKRQRKLMGIKD